MTQQTSFFPLMGGLDLKTPAIAIKPGRAISALNYEPAATGYRRMDGFERCDGRTSPTAAFEAAIAIDPDDATAARAAREAARAAIGAVPGEGPVRGIWSYGGEKYAFRDNIGATQGCMYRATPTGWTQVTFGRELAFTGGGGTSKEILEGAVIKGATSGATATVKRVVRRSGTWAAGDAAGYLVLDGQTGTFSAENLDVGATLDLATIAGNSSAITLAPGGKYEFANHNFYASRNLRRMYFVNGVNRACEFDGTTLVPIATGTPEDKPHRVAVHKMALALAFAGGSCQLSVIGEPTIFSGILGAVEIGVGDEIVDFIQNVNGALVILSETSVSVLYGSDVDTYQLETLSDEAGAIAHTADKVGNPIYMDKGGLRSLSATQAFGNFKSATLTDDISPLLDTFRRSGVVPTASVRVRQKDTYRLFFSDLSGLNIYMGDKRPWSMPFSLGKLVTCACSVETEAGEDIFFGSDDGFVYQMERGTSFDGEPISYYVRLPFNHLGGPHILKRFHKAVIECDASAATSLYLSADYDYGSPDQLTQAAIDVTVMGGGAFWDSAEWGTFYWDAPVEGTAEAYIDGVGKNMSLLIGGSASEEMPHTLHGMSFFITPRGLRR